MYFCEHFDFKHILDWKRQRCLLSIHNKFQAYVSQLVRNNSCYARLCKTSLLVICVILCLCLRSRVLCGVTLHQYFGNTVLRSVY